MAIPSGYSLGSLGGGYYKDSDGSGPYTIDANGTPYLVAGGQNSNTAAMLTLTAQGAGTVLGADQSNTQGRGVQVGVNITALTGTSPTVTVTIEGKDTASGAYYTLLASAAIAATGFTLLTVYPGAPSTANVSSPQVLPKTWRVKAVVAGTTPAATATIGASVIV